MTSYPPRGEVFSFDFVALVMGLPCHKKVLKRHPYIGGYGNCFDLF